MVRGRVRVRVSASARVRVWTRAMPRHRDRDRCGGRFPTSTVLAIAFVDETITLCRAGAMTWTVPPEGSAATAKVRAHRSGVLGRT